MRQEQLILTYSLVIETSTERGLAAFLKDGQIVFLKEFPFGVLNSKYLIPSIHEGLQALGIRIKDLSFIGTGIGPGSYTGIRVGAMTAKAMAYASQVPLIGICTLTCFAPPKDGPFAVLIDAKIGGAYVITGVKKGGGISYISDPQACELDKLESVLKNIHIILTPQCKVLQPKLQSLYPEANWEWMEMAPDPIQMDKIARKKYEKREIAWSGHLQLMYLRKTQAEIEKGLK